MSTHNICFWGDIRKIIFGYPLVPGAMYSVMDIFDSRSVIYEDEKIWLWEKKRTIENRYTQKKCVFLCIYIYKHSDIGVNNHYYQMLQPIRL